ncbi:hypothetical protein TREMEDRAFT_62478 [Tremella mesenterica DSM 1558]|uniref:uncharacterized protein n=1 Tax=Tremella mesenterica (strain ATCC 24925 / CBS 8224 / DSM 1558 / NBRC 9311 / NRRL Y-6157 / RJB 2259-6 / UBC 559-6) TaxID=578456 RepID=UPI0003F49190|nr:uncharacterized protein TREMEDRAFT_62478 [Tremella mesenterica DSM 1558]EIW69609.1 hypothetical protein TREMEDRAFT_62478 [Tremella mesenterica DSM 1558]
MRFYLNVGKSSRVVSGHHANDYHYLNYPQAKGPTDSLTLSMHPSSNLLLLVRWRFQGKTLLVARAKKHCKKDILPNLVIIVSRVIEGLIVPTIHRQSICIPSNRCWVESQIYLVLRPEG